MPGHRVHSGGALGRAGPAHRWCHDFPLAGGKLLANLTAGDDGRASLSFRLELGPGTYTLKAVFPGSKSYEGCEATATLVVRKRKVSLSLDYPDEVVAGEEFTITACLRDEEGEPIAGAEAGPLREERHLLVPPGEGENGRARGGYLHPHAGGRRPRAEGSL